MESIRSCFKLVRIGGLEIYIESRRPSHVIEGLSDILRISSSTPSNITKMLITIRQKCEETSLAYNA